MDQLIQGMCLRSYPLYIFLRQERQSFLVSGSMADNIIILKQYLLTNKSSTVSFTSSLEKSTLNLSLDPLFCFIGAHQSYFYIYKWCFSKQFTVFVQKKFIKFLVGQSFFCYPPFFFFLGVLELSSAGVEGVSGKAQSTSDLEGGDGSDGLRGEEVLPSQSASRYQLPSSQSEWKMTSYC